MEEEKDLENKKEIVADGFEPDIKELVKKNLELTEEIFRMTKKIKNFVFWERVLSVLKIIIIVVPLVLGIIYLPALLDNVIKPYQELLEMNPLSSGAQNLDLNDIDLNKIDLDKVRNLLK